MQEQAILDVGKIIHVTWKLSGPMRAREIIETYEYKMFKKEYPNLCKVIEQKENKNEKEKTKTTKS